MCKSILPAEKVLTPPSAYLPPIGRIHAYPLADLRTSIDYLRILYNPEVRGSRRKILEEALQEDDAFDSKLDVIRSDAFERAHAIRWLTALVARGDLLASTREGQENEVLLYELIEDAAALLAACAGAAAAGRVTRTFTFGPSPADETVTVPLADAPLENGDFGTIGAQTWGAACVLSDMLLANPTQFGIPLPGASAGAGSGIGNTFRVLEFGAGTGLVGLAAARLLEMRGVNASVCLSDVHPAVLSNLRTNAIANFPTSVLGPGADVTKRACVDVTVVSLDWESFASSSLEDCDALALGTFDLVLGADIVYEAQHATWLRTCVERLLAPHALFHLLIPLRSTHAFESGTIEKMFGNTGGNDSERAGICALTSGQELGIVYQERFVCDAYGGTGTARGASDEVEYVFYKIGWLTLA
ncbi:hypothetical protein M0805_009238 [Coniferiporia weirii]|nr:hypothetical protein M0805_009238 [Coniferiporia weirii]